MTFTQTTWLLAHGFVPLFLQPARAITRVAAQSFVAVSLAVLLLVGRAQAVTIDTVPVGNAGNAADTTGFGAVAYNYRIGTTEVTVGQYTEFLNAVAATDNYALYNPSMANLNIAGIKRVGASGSYSYSVVGSPNKPVTYVSWGDAARFVNWLNNGQPLGPQGPGTTETGAYTLNGATTAVALNAVSRNSGAQWIIPSEDEWYKAAYHQPAAQGGDSDDYWSYPTGTNAAPTSMAPPGGSNSANFRDAVTGYAVTGSTVLISSTNYLTNVGAYRSSPSFYGTYDQGGNVWEWNETLISESLRGVRGGGWLHNSSFLLSSYRDGSGDPLGEIASVGFRVATVASVPEPSTFALAAVGVAGLVFTLRKRRRVVAGLLLFAIASCCGAEARAVTIDTVPVGNAGNAPDPATPGSSGWPQLGAVSYEYRIGKYEVTVGQYTEFLNAVAASDPYAVYYSPMGASLIRRSGSAGAYTYSAIASPNLPVIFVDWGSAARFVNWLHNGQPTGPEGPGTTETGAYSLNGATTNAALRLITRNAGATWFLPSEDEWYKAAYYDPTLNGGAGGYWKYPTASNESPDSASPPGTAAPTPSNTANLFINDGLDNGYNDGHAVVGPGSGGLTSITYLSEVGVYTFSASPYGTFDQAGNVSEWFERFVGGGNNGPGYRGGDWSGNAMYSEATSSFGRHLGTPLTNTNWLGFRVATITPVPEPTTLVLSIVGILGMLALHRPRRVARCLGR